MALYHGASQSLLKNATAAWRGELRTSRQRRSNQQLMQKNAVLQKKNDEGAPRTHKSKSTLLLTTAFARWLLRGVRAERRTRSLLEHGEIRM